MKIEILKMLGKWIFGIYIFRGWITIDIPYRKINIMTDRVNKEIGGIYNYSYESGGTSTSLK